MPHLRLRAVSSDIVRELSQILPKELASVMNTSVDNFTFERVETVYYSEGRVVDSFPFVEVLWFARSQAIQDQCAQIITERVKALVPSLDVVVVFMVLPKESYYENGLHF